MRVYQQVVREVRVEDVAVEKKWCTTKQRVVCKKFSNA